MIYNYEIYFVYLLIYYHFSKDNLLNFKIVPINGAYIHLWSRKYVVIKRILFPF
jgi:hypothetical protein